MGSGRIDRARLDLTLLLLLAAGLTIMAITRFEPYSFLHGDGAFYANINRSLSQNLSLDQSRFHPRSWLEEDLSWNHNLDQGWSNVALGRDGETWWPKHPFLMPIVAMPFYILGGLLGLLIFNLSQTVLLLFVSYRLAQRVVPAATALLATLLFALQPLVWQSAYSYSNDVFYALLVVMAFDSLAAERPRRAGAILGLAVWAKLTNLFFAVPVIIWMLLARRKRSLLRFSIAFAIPVALYGISNWLMFGAPWTTSYDRIIIRQDGLMMLESARERLEMGIQVGLWRLVTDPTQGLFQQAPLALVTLPGIVCWATRRPGPALSVLASLVAYAVFFARYEYLYARFYLPWLGLGVTMAACALESTSRGLATAVIRTCEAAHALLSRRRWTFSLLLLPPIALCGLWAVNVANGRASERDLVKHVERAQVWLDDVPCDYFNNAHQKWECAVHERRPWQFAGRSLGDECVFDGQPREMLWIQPDPMLRTKRMRFSALPPTDTLVVRAGRSESSPSTGPAKIEIAVENGPDLLIEISDDQGLEEQRHPTPALKDGGGALEIKVPGRRGGPHGVCLQLLLPDARFEGELEVVE